MERFLYYNFNIDVSGDMKMNEDCSWEDVYKLNSVSPEYNKPIDEFDLLIEEIEAKLSNAGFEKIDTNTRVTEAISV